MRAHLWRLPRIFCVGAGRSKVNMRLVTMFLFSIWNEAVIASATKPNILMFVIDDLGWNDTSYKGSDIVSPTIDKLATQEIRL